MNFDIPSKRVQAICFSIFCALFFNAIFIYALQDFSIPPSSHRILYQALSQEEESMQRTEQLKEALNHWAAPQKKEELQIAQKEIIQEEAPQKTSTVIQMPTYQIDAEIMKEDFFSSMEQGASLFVINVNENSPSIIQEALKTTNLQVNEKSAHKSINEPNADPKFTLASSDGFELDVKYALSPEGDYLFRASFYPKKQIKFKRIKQNFYFLIDRSHSISKQRYQLAKSSLLDALTQLEKGDTFNILVFDDHVVRLSNENLPVTEETFVYATNWLSKQAHGGLFAGTELYTSLGQIIPKVVANSEVHTAILFSDGNTFLSREKQRLNIANWTQLNKGRIALFAIAVGPDNNIALLDLLTSMNKGALYYSSSIHETQSITRKLIEEIKRPIGKDLRISAISKMDKNPLILYPKQNRLSDLYEHRPLVLSGKIQKLASLYLFVQGRYYDSWLDIEKKIVFQDNDKVAYAELKDSWILHQANDVYDAYLQDGNVARLTQLRKLLLPLNLQPAFK